MANQCSFLAIFLIKINYIYSFTLPELSQRMIVRQSVAGGNEKACGRIEKKNKRMPYNNLNPEHGERSCTNEYRPQLRFEKSTRQNWLASSCSHGDALASNLPMMMMMIFVIGTSFKITCLEIHFGTIININNYLTIFPM